jgi:hypothetical protein
VASCGENSSPMRGGTAPPRGLINAAPMVRPEVLLAVDDYKFSRLYRMASVSNALTLYCEAQLVLASQARRLRSR